MVPVRKRLHAGHPFVVGHRGSPSTCPENTITSVREAFDSGAAMVELDVQLTADDRVVVIHDRTLKRTTRGRGLVSAMTYQQITAHDAGSWFDSRFAGEQIPLLEAVIAESTGRGYLNIELKSYPKGAERALQLVRSVLRIVSSARFGRYVLLSSFDHSMLEAARDLDDAIARAVIIHPLDYTSPSRRAAAVGADAVVLARRRMTRGRIADARSNGFAVLIYTLDHPRDILRAADLGVAGIITNRPAEAGTLLSARAGERAIAKGGSP